MPFQRCPQGGKWRWPLTRRNCLLASTMPAAHQRNAICPARQRLTFLAAFGWFAYQPLAGAAHSPGITEL